METARLAAFACYAAAALFAVAFGAVYMLRSSFMPYHEEALAKPWQQLEPRLQALLLGLMRTTGGGMLVGGVSAGILLLIPFRGGERWSDWAIPSIGLLTVLPSLYATLLVRSRTGAHTPVWAGAAAVGLIALGCILSMV
jgi:hypothetical protein